MKVKDLVIKFKHERDLEGYDGKHPIYKSGGKTYCRLITPEKTVEGVSVCSKEDQFNKDKGRKMALKRAIELANLSRQMRLVIWERYRCSTNEPKWE